jgi:hypothetical protein
MQYLPNLFSSNDAIKKNTLKLVFQNKGENNKTLSLNINKDFNNGEYNRRILTLSKNKELLGDKREYIFKRIFTPGIDKINNTDGKGLIDNLKSLNTDNRTNYKKFNDKKQLKDEFLLFAKARPYRYISK